jgi:hypothetical protein
MRRLRNIRFARHRPPKTRAGHVLAALDETFKNHPEHDGLRIAIVAIEIDGTVTLRAAGFQHDSEIPQVLHDAGAAVSKALGVVCLRDLEGTPSDG